MSRRAFSSIPERHSYAVRASSASKCSQGTSKGNNVRSKPGNTNMIINLIEFLENTGSDARLTCRDLNRPSTKLVFSIFEHLLRQINPSFSLPLGKNEVEECFVGTLRNFGYPGTLNKSMVSTPGAPHSWPHILNSLDWLLSLHQSTQSLIQNDEIFINSENQVVSEPPIAKTIWNFCLKSLTDKETSEKCIRDLKESIDLAFGCSSAKQLDVEKRKRELEAELESLRPAFDEDSLQKNIANARRGQRQANEEEKRVLSASKEVQTRMDALKIKSDELEAKMKHLQASVNEVEILVTAQDNNLGRMPQQYRLLRERYDQRVRLMNELNSELQVKSLENDRLKNYIAPAIDKFNRLSTSLVSLPLKSTLPMRVFAFQFDDAVEVPAMSAQIKELQKELHSLIAGLVKQTEDLKTAKRDSTDLLKRKKIEIENLKKKIAQEEKREEEINSSFTSRRIFLGTWESEIDPKILEAEGKFTQNNSTYESLVNSINEFEASYEYYNDLNNRMRERTSRLLTDVFDFLSTLRIRTEVTARNSVAKLDASKALQKEICDSFDVLDAELAQLNVEADKLDADLDS